MDEVLPWTSLLIDWAIHSEIEVLKSAMDYDVYLTFLPAGTTHWSQPLDNLLFACLKQEIKAVAQHLLVAQVFMDEDIFSLVEIVLESGKKGFTGFTIISAFSGTGIFPLIRRNLESWLT